MLQDLFQRLETRLDVEALLTKAVAFLPNLLVALLFLVAAAWIYRLIRRPLAFALERSGMAPPVVQLISTLLRGVIMTLGLMMALGQIGINVGAALAGLGIAGLAVGFAAQDSLANFIAGILVFADKPFVVGDWVTVSGEHGQVVEVTMRSTRIRTRDNKYVVIPNQTIIDEVLVNHSKNGETRVNVPVGIAYKEDILAARQVLLKALEGVDDLMDDPAPDVVVTELGDSSVNLQVRVWVHEAADEAPVEAAVLEASKLALDAAGIEIPFPHMQLFVDEVQEPVWDKARVLFNKAT